MNNQSKFNSVGPVAYFLTFSTYGSRFHGDDRGSVDRRFHNIPGTPYLKPNETLVNYERNLCKQFPVAFNPAQRKSVEHTIREVCKHNKWTLHAVNARTKHVHVVLTAIKRPELVMNSLKSWCTRKLRENGLLSDEIKPWSRHGSTRYLWDERALYYACRYVIVFQDDKPGMVREEALPNGRATGCIGNPRLDC